LGDELAGAGAVEALVMVHASEPALVIDAPLGELDGWGRRRRLCNNCSGAGGACPAAGAGGNNRSGQGVGALCG
jgi:hypothetical protein